jgi:hypothetical protein
MGVADHVLESITGHLSRRMLEHYSHIRIDAKRQALDALDVQRGRVLRGTGNGNDGDPQNAELKAIIEVPDSVTSQSRHSLLLQGSPPSGKLLIPLNRRDVRVVEGARLESVCRGNSTEGSNPSLSESLLFIDFLVFSTICPRARFSPARRVCADSAFRFLRFNRSCRASSSIFEWDSHRVRRNAPGG